MPDLLREPREVMREEMLMRDQVLDALADGPLTVPEIAEIIGFPAHEVMYWVMAAWKYGYVKETGATDDDHFQYAVVVKEQ